MNSITMRELQKRGGSIKEEDLPIIIKRYNDPQFVLISIDAWDSFLEVDDYGVGRLKRENELFRKTLKAKGFSPERVIDEGEDLETQGPVKKTHSQVEFRKQLEKMGLNLGMSSD